MRDIKEENMEAKHTPGPWIAKKGAGWFVTRPDAQDRKECALAVGMSPNISLVNSPQTSWYTDDEEKANAYLMAAAPDLLAACEAFTGDFPDKIIDFYGWFQERVNQARKAIAKGKDGPKGG